MAGERRQVAMLDVCEHDLNGVPRSFEFGGERGTDCRWEVDLKVGMH